MSARLLLLSICLLAGIRLSAQRIGGSTPVGNDAARYLSKVPEGTIFYEGFENAQRPSLPQGWISQSNATTGFITGTGGDAPSQANENGFWPIPLHGIFAMSNDDVCNCDKSQDRLISPIINASGLDHLFLAFEAFQNGSGGQTAHLEIKAQGLPWLNVLNIPASTAWEHYEVSIPKAYLTKAFQFRFNYSDEGNYASGLAIDDILLGTSSIEALGIVSTQLLAGERGTGTVQIQRSIPLTQARNLKWNPAALVQNQGTQVKNARFESRLLGPINQTITDQTWRIEAGVSQGINGPLYEALTPHEIGSYTAEVEVLTDSTDAITTDNLVSYGFDVVDSGYAWVPFSSNYYLGAWIQSVGDRFGSGFNFYTTDSLIAVRLNIHPSSEAGARFRVKVFSYDTLSSSIFSSPVFELEEEDIGSILRLPIETRVSSGRRLIVVEKESGSERLVLALSNARRSRAENSLTKKALGNWLESAYFPQMELITLPPTFPCDAYILSEIVPPSCAGLDDGSIDLNVQSNNGALTYAWSNGAGNVSALTGLEGGSYNVTVSDVNGCTYARSIALLAPDTFEVVASVTADSCDQGIGAIQLNMSGGTAPYTNIWEGDTLGNAVSQLTRGLYPSTVIDANGCSWTDTIHVPGTENLGVILNPSSPTCGDTNGMINTVAVGTAPLQFSWSTGAVGPSLSNVSAGIYTLTLTDSIGCSIAEEVAVNDQNAPSINLNGITDVNCEGASSGAIALNVGGGTLPYSFEWSNGATTEDLDSLSVGTYRLSLTDQQGCRAFGRYEVSTDAMPIILDFNERGNYCWKDSNARLEVLVNGGVAPYTYAWSNGSADGMIDDLGAGTYSVTVTDLDGCSKTRSVEVAEGPPFFVQLDSSQEDTSTSVLINGYIFMSTYGGTPPYSHNWNDSIDLEDLLDVQNGAYTLIARDQLGCVEFFAIDLGKGPVGIPTAKEERAMLIYPNPAIQGTPVHVLSAEAFTSYQWYDLQGRLLQEGSLNSGNGLPTPAASNGLFILRLHGETGLEHAVRILVEPR